MRLVSATRVPDTKPAAAGVAAQPNWMQRAQENRGSERDRHGNTFHARQFRVRLPVHVLRYRRPWAENCLAAGVNATNVTFGTEQPWDIVLRDFDSGLEKSSAALIWHWPPTGRKSTPRISRASSQSLSERRVPRWSTSNSIACAPCTGWACAISDWHIRDPPCSPTDAARAGTRV